MKYFIYILLFAMLCSACSHSAKRSEETSLNRDSILEPQLMVEYLAKIYLIEAAIYKAQQEERNTNEYAIKLYHGFFSQYGLNRDKLKYSVEFYMGKRKMEWILQEVIAELTEMETHMTHAITADSSKTSQKPRWLEKINDTIR